MRMAYMHRPLLRLLMLLGAGQLFLPGCEQRALLPSRAQDAIVAFAPAQQVPLPDFVELVKRQGAAVVSISSTKKIIGRPVWPGRPEIPGLPGLAPNNPLFDFFRRFGLDEMPLQEFHNQSLGSGFIIDRDGYILTNAHVVADADEVKVGLTDKREFTAKLVGMDPRTDIALLKIPAGDLPVVNIGDPSRLQVGEWIVAIGTPFGFANSVTQGIVSAKGRALPGDKIVSFIQTDAAINPGSSGGPLFNLNGEVVGINSQIYSQSGGYMGLSFAIPIDVAIRVKDQLLKHGKVRRGRLGVSIQDVSAELAESFGLEAATGALISFLEKGGAAERAGLQIGDIVLQVNGKAVADSAELARAISEMAPGDSVRLQIWRNAAAIVIAATLGNADAEPERKEAKPAASMPDRLGLSLREMNPTEQRARQTEGRLVVEAVAGVAARAGIQPGDIIISVNNKPVSTVEQLRDELAKIRKRAALLVQRDANTKIFVSLLLAEE